MKVKIPKTFELAGQTIKTKVSASIETEGAVGLSKFHQNEIRVRTKLDGEDIVHDVQVQTFFHEMAHMLMYIMNEHELNNNEKFIDNLGQFLYQYEKSKKF